MKQPYRVAVDIGNSGARLVPLPGDSDVALPQPLRINWHQEVCSLTNSLSLFSPDKIAWEKQLRPFLLHESITEWWISSVQRAATESLVAFLEKQKNCRVQLVDYRCIPMEVDVEYPERVGIDRLLAAYAASQLMDAHPLLVIQAGTAVTVDLVESVSFSSNSPRRLGRFAGGAILPGVPMMLRLLGRAADLLPQVAAAELVELPPLPGRNSQAAMLAGASSCLVGGVQHLIKRYRDQLQGQIPIVLSGGDGPLLKPHLLPPVKEIDHLVLQGLRMLSDLPPSD